MDNLDIHNHKQKMKLIAQQNSYWLVHPNDIVAVYKNKIKNKKKLEVTDISIYTHI